MNDCPTYHLCMENILTEQFQDIHYWIICKPNTSQISIITYKNEQN